MKASTIQSILHNIYPKAALLIQKSHTKSQQKFTKHSQTMFQFELHCHGFITNHFLLIPINKTMVLIIIIMLKAQKRDILLQCTSNRGSERHTSQSSQFSENAITRYIESRLKNEHTVSRREIEEMNERVKNQLMRNRKNYEKLVMMNPYFSMKLFSPNNNFSSQQYNSSSLNLMIQQLDLLLEDGHLLQKEIKKTELRKMQSDYMNNYQIDNSKHHYAYIRKIWLNSNEADAKNPLERIQQLNKKVVLVKNNLYSLTDIEKKSYERNHSNASIGDYGSVVSKINEVVQQTKEYSMLKEKYENLKMSYQQLQSKFEQLKLNYAQIQLEKNQALKKLKQQNDQCRRMLKQSKEKQISIELRQAQLLLKIKELQSAIKQKKQEKSQVPASISLLKNEIIKAKLIVNMQDIKFRKIEVKDVIIAEKQRQMQEESGNRMKKEVQQPLQYELSEPKVSRFSPVQESYENLNQNTDRSFNFGDEKSPDGKKGRFIRMRSPVGGKLMKKKEEQGKQGLKKNQFTSPKVKESQGKNLI